MAPPQNPYDAVLHAARDVTRLDCALDAEMLGTALLGSVYAIAQGDDRNRSMREFVGAFLAATSRRRSAAATSIRRVFAALVPQAPGAAGVRAPGQAPEWISQLARVRLTGSYAYGDRYGDQTSYLATFAYDDAVAGGPDHAVVVLVDHNIGIVKDAFVGAPADEIVQQVRDLCSADELTWFREEDPRRLRGEVARHLTVTDGLAELPATGSLATDRALVGARIALLPPPALAVVEDAPAVLTAEQRTALVREFLAGPEATGANLHRVEGPELASLHFCLSLVLDHAATMPDGDPLRWSPAVAGLFLLDWVHRRAVLDLDDAAMLPRVVRAWAAFAARRKDLPQAAAEQTDAAVAELVPEFVRLYRTGERRSPATAAVAQLMAEGVDPDDPDALEGWLEANRQRLGDDPA